MTVAAKDRVAWWEFVVGVVLLIGISFALVSSVGGAVWADTVIGLMAFTLAAPIVAVVGRFIYERTA